MDMEGKQKPIMFRTYRDTAFMFLPANKYNLEARPLEGSDVATITISNVQSFEDKTVHKSISFDAGKIEVSTLNNGEGWDATVNIFLVDTGKNVARGRTYGKARTMEVSPGLYNVEMKVLGIKGSVIEHTVNNVEVMAGETSTISHNFESGIAKIGVQNADGLVDATVNIIDLNTNKNVARGRTYTRTTSNPKEFVLNPGNYEVIVKPVSGANKGETEKFNIEVKAGEQIERIKEY